jgi:hypothetical protein
MSYENYGYIPDVAFTQQYASTLPYQSIGNLAADDDGRDVFLYRALVKCLQNSPLASVWLKDGKVRSYNQGNIGSCTGNAEALCLSLESALDIVERGEPQEFKWMVSPESCYGASREVGGNLGGGAGSSGGACAKASTTIGCLYQTTYPSIDLSTYTVEHCSTFGRSGIPADLKPIAAEHKLQSSYLVKDGNEAWSIIGAGSPINQCSGQGWKGNRDDEGYIAASGSWSHSMCICGRRTSQKHGKCFLIANSWGDSWTSGGLYLDQPAGYFYADFNSVDKAIRSGDSFCKVGMNGFVRRNLDWGSCW